MRISNEELRQVIAQLPDIMIDNSEDFSTIVMGVAALQELQQHREEKRWRKTTGEWPEQSGWIQVTNNADEPAMPIYHDKHSSVVAGKYWRPLPTDLPEVE